jgi:hypothetical protein
MVILSHIFLFFIFLFYTSLEHSTFVSKVLEGKDLKRGILLRLFIFKIIQSEFRYLISVNSLYNLLDHAVGT